MPPVVKASNLRKVYRTDGVAVHALNDIDLLVERGDFVAVMGPSGCGKSTLLHLLAGLERPTEGEITVDGHHINGMNESQRAVLRRETIGFIFQAYNLIPNLTVADNVEMPSLLAGHNLKDAAQKRNALLDTLGIADKANAFPSQLSGGQQQRVAIARALINDPTLLLADEPTGNLDSRSGAGVLLLLRRFNEGRQTIVLVTHDPKVASFARNVIFMRDGRFVSHMGTEAGGDPSQVIARMIEIEA